MIIWRRSGGCNDTTPRCRSRNIANNTFSEGWLQDFLRICRFADGASQPPCKKHCKYHAFMQNGAKCRFWDHTMGGGSEPRTGIIYIYMYIYMDVSENSGTPKTHPKCWSFSVGNPMGQLGKPNILGNTHIHVCINTYIWYLYAIHSEIPPLEKNSSQRPAAERRTVAPETKEPRRWGKSPVRWYQWTVDVLVEVHGKKGAPFCCFGLFLGMKN